MAVENSRTFLDSPLLPPSSREKKAYYAQGEGEVHAVVALDIHAMEPQPLGAHGCQREEEARQRQLLVPPPSGGFKQKEQWREEQAIAGIAAQCKNAVVKGPKQRDPGNQSIVTVPAQTDEIE